MTYLSSRPPSTYTYDAAAVWHIADALDQVHDILSAAMHAHDDDRPSASAVQTALDLVEAAAYLVVSPKGRNTK